MPNKVRWGVLSTAKIGTKKVIPAMQKGEWSSVTAIASRDLGKAKDAARELGIARRKRESTCCARSRSA